MLTRPNPKPYRNVSAVTFSSAPFVRGEFVNQYKKVSFLFHTGSDLSLISTDKVDKQTLNKLQQLGVKQKIDTRYPADLPWFP